MKPKERKQFQLQKISVYGSYRAIKLALSMFITAKSEELTSGNITALYHYEENLDQYYLRAITSDDLDEFLFEVNGMSTYATLINSFINPRK